MDNTLEQLAKALVDLLRNDGLPVLQEVLPGDVLVGEVSYDGFDAEFEITSLGRSFRVVIDEIEG